MGIRIPNSLRATVIEFNNKVVRGIESFSGVQDARIMRIMHGKPDGSRFDGSPYMVIFAMIGPGERASLRAYKPEVIELIKKMRPGMYISAVCSPLDRGVLPNRAWSDIWEIIPNSKTCPEFTPLTALEIAAVSRTASTSLETAGQPDYAGPVDLDQTQQDQATQAQQQI